MELCGAVNAMRSSCYRDDYFCGVFDRNLWNVCWIWSVYPSISLASSLHFQCPGKKKRKKKTLTRHSSLSAVLTMRTLLH